MGDIEKIIIIGTGNAGYTAAIYAARANLNPLVIEGYQQGGQLAITTDVENFPGFPDGIQGPELMELMRKQAERFGTRTVSGMVQGADFSKRPFHLTLDNGKGYQAESVIIATGAAAKYIGLRAERDLLGYGVSACATCDGAFFRGKEVAVVGGGDTAMEESTFLTKFASKVTVIHRRDSLRASKIMQEKARKNPKIEWIWDTTVADVLDPKQKKVTGLKLKNVKTGKESDFKTDGLFLAIGHEPGTGFLKGHIELDPKGFIILKKYTMTSVDGVFAAGDCVDHRYKQAVTAAGMGCQAALDAEKWLEGNFG